MADFPKRIPDGPMRLSEEDEARVTMVEGALGNLNESEGEV